MRIHNTWSENRRESVEPSTFYLRSFVVQYSGLPSFSCGYDDGELWGLDEPYRFSKSDCHQVTVSLGEAWLILVSKVLPSVLGLVGALLLSEIDQNAVMSGW